MAILTALPMAALRGKSLARPFVRPMSYFLISFMIAWCLSALNGLNFNVMFEYSDIAFFYRLFFYFSAWWIGYQSRDSIYRIVSSKFALGIIACVTALAIIYPFLSHDTRLELLSRFGTSGETLVEAALRDRFTGIGQNINIYSFVPVFFLIFSFHAFLSRRGGIFTPLCCMIIILAGSSRKTFLLALICIVILYTWAKPLMPSMGRSATKDRQALHRRRTSGLRNRFAVGFIILLVGIGLSRLVESGVIGQKLVTKLTPDKAISDTIYRSHKMKTGMQRIALAPVLGIPDPAGRDWSGHSFLVEYRSPHNEFIQIWMWYGVLGLIAHVYLIGWFLIKNVKLRSGLPWVLFYLVVIAQLSVDTAFKSYQFSAVFFMVAGMNLRGLEERMGRARRRPFSAWGHRSRPNR
jgi:hypothetical protein